MGLLCDLLKSSSTIQQQLLQSKGFLVISYLLEKVKKPWGQVGFSVQISHVIFIWFCLFLNLWSVVLAPYTFFKRTFVENAQPLCQLHQVCFETLESGYNILSFLLICHCQTHVCQSSKQLQPLRLSQILSLLLKPKEWLFGRDKREKKMWKTCRLSTKSVKKVTVNIDRLWDLPDATRGSKSHSCANSIERYCIKWYGESLHEGLWSACLLTWCHDSLTVTPDLYTTVSTDC